MRRVRIIAEAGVNHNGDVSMAKRMIEVAREAGADAVKFQTYHAGEVMTEATPLAGYMEGKGKTGGGFLKLAERLELSEADTVALKRHAEEQGISFLSSPFDERSVRFLKEIGLKELKIPSGETVNPYLLKAAAGTGLPLIVSTGMCTLEEIRWAIGFLERHKSGPVTLLHCVTQYPAEFRHLNLSAIPEMKKRFGLPVGFSDHSPGIEAAVASVALGAVMIEKHFTPDRSLPGPDHRASLSPDELKALVRAVRNVESAMGNGRNGPAPPELEIARVARKSLVFRREAKAGAILTEDMLAAKRPGTGVPAGHLDRVLGRRLRRDVSENELLVMEDIQ